MLGTVLGSIKGFLSDDGMGLAAELSYRAFLAIAPFFIFLAALSGVIAALLGIPDPARRLLDVFGTTVPGNIAGLLRDQLEATVGRSDVGLLSFGLAGALLAATGGTNAVIKAMNRAYDVEESRPFWRKYLLALGITLLAATMALAAMILVLAARFLGVPLARALGLEDAAETTLALAPLPVVLVLLIVGAGVLYRFGPNVHVPLRGVIPGALAFSLLWVAATYVFSIYVDLFGTYSVTYGALGAVVVLLIWLYLVSAALVYGAELNAEIVKRSMPDHVEKERRRTQKEAGGAARGDEAA